MDRIDWDALCGRYSAHHFAAWCRRKYAGEFELPAAAVARIARPAPADVAWLTDALKHGTQPPAGGKWFVSQLLRRSDSMAESLLVPVLDAAIDEVDPSYNQHFVRPCDKAFGERRVFQYLLSVVESGTDFRKAGAVNALYWVGWEFRPPAQLPSSEVELLRNLLMRKRCLLLETFVENPSLDVRRSIISKLNLKPADYPDSHRALVSRAIDIARRHEDGYIRRRVEVQLGDLRGGFPCLPDRRK